MIFFHLMMAKIKHGILKVDYGKAAMLSLKVWQQQGGVNWHQSKQKRGKAALKETCLTEPDLSPFHKYTKLSSTTWMVRNHWPEENIFTDCNWLTTLNKWKKKYVYCRKYFQLIILELSELPTISKLFVVNLKIKFLTFVVFIVF